MKKLFFLGAALAATIHADSWAQDSGTRVGFVRMGAATMPKDATIIAGQVSTDLGRGTWGVTISHWCKVLPGTSPSAAIVTIPGPANSLQRKVLPEYFAGWMRPTGTRTLQDGREATVFEWIKPADLTKDLRPVVR